MPIFANRRNGVRLAPELDDADLGRVRRQLESAQGRSVQVDLVAEVVRHAGTDWDLRTRRIVVLAEAAKLALAKFWYHREPDNADALLFYVWVQYYHARRQRDLTSSRDLIKMCYRAADLHPDDPVPWVALLATFRSIQRHQSDVFHAWREIKVRDSWNREGHLQMLGYLSPEECGSHSLVLDLLDQVKFSMPPGAPASIVELIPHVERHHKAESSGGVNSLLADRQWLQQPAVSVLEKALRDWPSPGFLKHSAAIADLNLLAYALVLAKRPRDAATVFEKIGDTITEWPWGINGDPLRRYVHWRKWALR
ncbi:hypothetical protein [Streptomyces sp. NBC_01643]|uniref:hypothetical protein n=1 Tax=Streptomyces sp. NBC_01643 TaxID=2975906 RepID=UPI00386A2C20|nr:hypothetical protein OHB03_47895 [Streptomyces sp. NBC_01643]